VKIRNLMLGSDVEAMRQFCIERFDVDPSQYGLTLVGIKQERCFPYDCDEGNIVFIKNRLAERGAFQRGESMPLEAHTARLHVFFLSLDETPEMWSRLKADETAIVQQIPRSKLAKTTQCVRPVDSVAMNVAPFPADFHPPTNGARR